VNELFDKTSDYDIDTIVFGKGSVGIAGGWIDDPSVNIGIVTFQPQPAGPIGKKPPHFPDGTCFKEVSETPATLQFVFTKVESIDVLIEELDNAKKFMLA